MILTYDYVLTRNKAYLAVGSQNCSEVVMCWVYQTVGRCETPQPAHFSINDCPSNARSTCDVTLAAFSPLFRLSGDSFVPSTSPFRPASRTIMWKTLLQSTKNELSNFHTRLNTDKGATENRSDVHFVDRFFSTAPRSMNLKWFIILQMRWNLFFK